MFYLIQNVFLPQGLKFMIYKFFYCHTYNKKFFILNILHNEIKRYSGLALNAPCPL